MTECHFLAHVMSRQSRVQASKASPAQKSQGLRVVSFKNFSRATSFVFWVTWLENSYLNDLPMKQIWRKSAVWYSFQFLVGDFNLDFFFGCRNLKGAWCNALSPEWRYLEYITHVRCWSTTLYVTATNIQALLIIFLIISDYFFFDFFRFYLIFSDLKKKLTF